MPEGYLHLTCEQRCQIYALLQSGHSQAHIARQIGVDPSTISRELVRNTGARGYRFKQAHEKASQRRQEASDKPRKMTPDLVELIEEKRIHPVGAAGMALSELTAPSRQAARASGIGLRQFHGSSAARSVILWSAILASTSASQAWGSTSLSLAV